MALHREEVPTEGRQTWSSATDGVPSSGSLAVLAATVAAFGAGALRASNGAGNQYIVTNLVSDQPGVAPVTDPHLVNGWGLTRLAGSPWWVADNGTNTSTLYNGAGTPQALVVTVPGGPTGAAANAGTGFVVHSGAASGAARFLFVNEDGQLYGWSPTVPAAGSTQATLADTVPDAIFKGLTLSGDRLYASDFHGNRVIVWDSGLNRISVPGGFADAGLPDGYAPFGIQAIDDRIFVTYARQDEEAEDELAGRGLGIVDMFNRDGDLLGRVGSHNFLNAPWGVARAPDNFGAFSGDLLVGNFGDGRILAFRPFGACRFGSRVQAQQGRHGHAVLPRRGPAARREPPADLDRRAVGHRLRRGQRQLRAGQHPLLRSRTGRRGARALRDRGSGVAGHALWGREVRLPPQKHQSVGLSPGVSGTDPSLVGQALALRPRLGQPPLAGDRPSRGACAGGSRPGPACGATRRLRPSGS